MYDITGFIHTTSGETMQVTLLGIELLVIEYLFQNLYNKLSPNYV